MVSVIIPTYNRGSALEVCLSAVTALDDSDYEVIVVDDGSTDGTEERVRTRFPGVRFFRLEENQGPAAARNRGLREAAGGILAFTDDDCVPPRDWLRRHLAHHRDPKVGAVGGLQVPDAPSFFDKVQWVHYAEEHGSLMRIESIEAWEGLATSNLSVKREVFERIGSFDEAFLTGSDPEFVRRACRSGYVLIRDPRLTVRHLKRNTLASYLGTRFHRGCGSILTDLKEGSLSARRFVPLPNVARTWRDWRHFRQEFGGGVVVFWGFWGLAAAARWADVAGRTYYYWTRGRDYRGALRPGD